MKIFKAILKYTGFAVLALVALSLVAHAVLNWITGSRLEARLQALRDAGEPLTLLDLARPPLPPEQNAATFLNRARAAIEAVNKELQPVYDREDQEDYQQTEEDRKAIRAALDAYPQLFPLLEQAASCPDYNDDLDYTTDPQVFIGARLKQDQCSRGAVGVLAVRVKLQIAEGKGDEALHTVATILRLARHLEKEPALISHLVVCAFRNIGVEEGNRVLRSCEVSAKARGELDAELARAASPEAYAKNITTERVFGMEMLRGLTFWLNRPYIADQQCFHLDLVAENLALTSKTYAETSATFDRLKQEAKSWRYGVVNLMVPAFLQVYAAECRTRALVRSLRVLNALQQHPPVAEGTHLKLEDLGLPAEAITDPYNGLPLHVKKVSGEWVIYAVGKDLVDDGGDFFNFKDVGIGALTSEATVFRRTQLAVGKIAPEMEGEEIDSKKFKLSDYRGKVTVVYFWGSWCDPCRAMIPRELALAEKLGNAPFALIGINTDKDKDKAKAFLEKEKITWTQVWDGGSTEGPLSTGWKVESFPTVYVLDAGGVIRLRSVGEPGPEFERMVESLVVELKR